MKKRAHGTGSICKRGSGYSVRWMTGGRVTVRTLRDSEGKPVKTLREAELAAEAFLSPYRLASEAETAKALAARADTITARVDQVNAAANPGTLLRQGWEAYLAEPSRPDTGAATLRQYEIQYEAFARWMVKHYPEVQRLNEVTSEHAGRFATWLKKGRAPGTYNKYLNLLDLVWTTLKRGDHNRQNEKPPRTGKHRIGFVPWSREAITRSDSGAASVQGRRELALPEIKAIVDQAEGELRTLLEIGLYTGLRLGDAVNLDWSEVFFSRGVIVTVPNKTSRSSGATVAIPISAGLRRELEALGPLASGPVLPGLAAEYQRDRSAVNRQVLKLFERAGVKTSVAVPGRRRQVMIAGFHSLRHSFITNAALLGWPEALVRSIVGHSSGAVTRRYIHLTAEAVKSLPAMPDPLALPETTEPKREALPAWVRAELGKMTASNWRKVRGAMLA